MPLPVRRDGTPTPTLEQRVEAGVALFDKGRVDYLLFSGGHPGTCPATSCLLMLKGGCWRLRELASAGGGLRNRSEAEVMRDYAVQCSSRTLAPDRHVSTQLHVLLPAQVSQPGAAVAEGT